MSSARPVIDDRPQGPTLVGGHVKHTMKVTAAVVLGALVSASGITGGSAQALGVGCPVEYYYKYTNVTNSFRPAAGVNPVWGGPGVVIGITMSQGKTITGTVGGSVSTEVSAIVAGAKVDVNGSISLSKTTTVIYSGSKVINATWKNGGFLHVGGVSKAMTWAYANTTPTCGERIVRTGTANLPYAVPAFWVTQA
jgi:hypothetical protein